MARDIALTGVANELISTLELLAERLTDNELLTLKEGLKSPESRMTTGHGTANDALWSALEKLGLMQEVPLPEILAKVSASTGVKMKIFSITPLGRIDIPNLIKRLHAN